MVGNTHSTTQEYSLCCGRGKIKLGDEVDQPPKLLMELINGNHPKSATFIDNIRRYNSMFALTDEVHIVTGFRDKITTEWVLCCQNKEKHQSSHNNIFMIKKTRSKTGLTVSGNNSKIIHIYNHTIKLLNL